MSISTQETNPVAAITVTFARTPFLKTTIKSFEQTKHVTYQGGEHYLGFCLKDGELTLTARSKSQLNPSLFGDIVRDAAASLRFDKELRPRCYACMTAVTPEDSKCPNCESSLIV